MLKLLLGHWKAHRKKPSLLPADGDVHFEEPSTINPLFEDSDSSTSSSNRNTHSEPLEQSQNFSQIENSEHNRTENDESLQNQASSQVENEEKRNETNQSIETQASSQVTTEQNKSETGVSSSSELTEVLNSNQVKDSEQSDTKLPNTEITDVEINENHILEKNITELISGEENKPSTDVESEVTNQNNAPLATNSHENSPDSSSTVESKLAHTKTIENMRLYNQPSTSVVTGNKKRVDEVSNGVEKKNVSASKTTSVNKEKNSSVKKVSDLDSNKTNSVLSSVKQSTENPVTSKQVQNSNEAEKPEKLRAKAIDELIKKFQGPKTENKSENNTSKVEKENIVNQPTNVRKLENKTTKENIVNQPTTIRKLENKITKSENANSPSPSIPINKDVHKITKPQTKELPKTSNLKVETDKPNKNSQEIEALSNIFKFPPPPPLEHIQNESSLHGKILNGRKINPPPINNKIKENEGEKKDINSGKTRSDSSLDRTRTASSSKVNDDVKLEISDTKETANKIDKLPSKEPSQLRSTEAESSVKDVSSNKNKDKLKRKTSDSAMPTKSATDVKLPASKDDIAKDSVNKTKKTESVLQSSQNTSKKKESPVSSPKTGIPSNPISKTLASSSKNAPKSPVQIHKSIISKTSPKLDLVNETDNIKLNSEDSGITRGDQISSETTQELPANDQPEQTTAIPNSSRKSKKEKKLKSANKKICKNCRHAHTDNIPVKRSPCDDYYDGLTGIRHIHKNRHSDSWTSDLSWEERELLRRLRSRRGTVRSSTPSMKSKISKHRFIDENYFRRLHNFRRSVSDDSSFYGASLCSCDECWAMYVKDYAYGRASLRGMLPIREICTCRNPHHNTLGRRVQFRPDIIPEATPSERTMTTPAPSVEKKLPDDADDKSSQKSTKSKEGDSVSTHPDGHKAKKSKNPEDIYRIVSPWELEELDLLMRKHLLKKRRRRARCMGIMALAMVVFIGLVVAIVMVYLRRKTL